MSFLVRPTRIERATPSLGNLCSILLSYGRSNANAIIRYYSSLCQEYIKSKSNGTIHMNQIAGLVEDMAKAPASKAEMISSFSEISPPAIIGFDEA